MVCVVRSICLSGQVKWFKSVSINASSFVIRVIPIHKFVKIPHSPRYRRIKKLHLFNILNIMNLYLTMKKLYIYILNKAYHRLCV